MAAAPPPAGILRALALGLLIAMAIGLTAPRPAIGPMPGGAVQLFGAAVGAYALLVALAWQPVPWLSRRVAAVLDDLVEAGEGTWYVSIALAHVTLSQVASTVATWLDESPLADKIEANLLERLMGFSVDTFLNAWWASLWPFRVWDEYGGTATIALAAGLYGICWLGRRVFGDTPIPRAADPARD